MANNMHTLNQTKMEEEVIERKRKSRGGALL